MGVCNCSMLWCSLLYVLSSFAIILKGKRELVASLGLSCWCLVIVGRLFLAVRRVCLQFLIVLFPDHTHYFYQNILSDHSLHDLHLYIRKMLTYIEMVNFQKWDFFDFFYTFTINCVTTKSRKMLIEYMCCFICSEQCIKII